MLPGKEESVAKSTTIAVDLAKNVFELAVSDRPGRVASRHRLSRTQPLRFFARRRQSTDQTIIERETRPIPGLLRDDGDDESFETDAGKSR